MSDNVKIKICKVEDTCTAKKLEKLGVDFIGFHIIWELTHDKEILYHMLRKELTKLQIVVVTQIKNIAKLNNMFDRLDLQYLQLHSRWNRNEIKHLREFIKSGYPKIISVVALETPTSVEVIDELAGYCDYILFDSSWRGGTGNSAKEEIIREGVDKANSYNIKFFIAGGLNPSNVHYYIKTYKPFGVDVQSGVRTSGHIDFNKVKQFIKECRGV